METQTRAEQRDLSTYQSHIVFVFLQVQTQFTGVSLAHPGSPWEKYTAKSSQASETEVLALSIR